MTNFTKTLTTALFFLLHYYAICECQYASTGDSYLLSLFEFCAVIEDAFIALRGACHAFRNGVDHFAGR